MLQAGDGQHTSWEHGSADARGCVIGAGLIVGPTYKCRRRMQGIHPSAWVLTRMCIDMCMPVYFCVCAHTHVSTHVYTYVCTTDAVDADAALQRLLMPTLLPAHTIE